MKKAGRSERCSEEKAKSGRVSKREGPLVILSELTPSSTASQVKPFIGQVSAKTRILTGKHAIAMEELLKPGQLIKGCLNSCFSIKTIYIALGAMCFDEGNVI